MYCSTKYINILLYYCSLELTGNQSYTTSTHIPIHHTLLSNIIYTKEMSFATYSAFLILLSLQPIVVYL